MLRVLCLVPYPTIGASNRLRVEQYVPVLRPSGIEFTVSPYYDDAAYAALYASGRTAQKAAGVVRGLMRRVRDLRRAVSFDLVLVHREATPIGPPVIERALCRRGLRYVYDIDDAIFLPAIHPVNRRWAWLRSPARVSEIAASAAAIVAGNEYLASWARALNGDVTVIPTPVDTDRHRPRSGARPPGPLVIGWVGSSTTAPYLRMLDVPLARVARDRNVCVRVIGGRYAAPGVPAEERPYSLAGEVRELQAFDIGVLPEPDDPWTRGKGAFKALLYMATGVPVVASRVGVNPDVIEHEVTGFCVGGPDEWARALERLVIDPELRARMGAAGRHRVEERYSVTVQAPRLAGVIYRVAAQNGRT